MAIRLSKQQARAVTDDYMARLRRCVPWTSAVQWKPQLEFTASTYKVLELFPGVVASDEPVHSLEPGMFVDSPTRTFRYCVRLQRHGRPMHTWWRDQVGTVVFDGDVIIPALFEAQPEGARDEKYWNDEPWMSLTPAELITLRPGTRMAKGKVVIAGLGLGHQLIEVSKRLPVKRIVLVERNQELVDWILPAVRPYVRKPLEVLIGDAYEVLPKIQADVALIDIFPGYGDGFREMKAIERRCPGIKKFWGWGAFEMTGLGQR